MVTPLFMGYATENGATLLELPQKSSILRKRKKKLLLEIEKKGYKKIENFSKTARVDEPESSKYNQSRQIQGSESRGNVFTRKLYKYYV